MYSEKNIILRATAATHIGYVRSANEDNFYLNGIFFLRPWRKKQFFLI